MLGSNAWLREEHLYELPNFVIELHLVAALGCDL